VHLARREFPAARVVRAVQGGRGIDNEQGKAGLAWGVAVAVGGSGSGSGSVAIAVAVAVAVVQWYSGSGWQWWQEKKWRGFDEY
jgi:hypothetical protein